jgi:hypothetical protein
MMHILDHSLKWVEMVRIKNENKAEIVKFSDRKCLNDAHFRPFAKVGLKWLELKMKIKLRL